MQEIASKRKLGKRLKSLRIKEQLSQEELAKILGISRSNYSQIELGKQYPSYQSLHILCKYFDKDYGWILNNDDDDLKNLPKTSLSQSVGNKKNWIFPFIGLVGAKSHKAYLQNCDDPKFIEKLPQISFPIKDANELRAFEVSKNFPKLNLFKGDIVVGSKVANLRDVDLQYVYLILKNNELRVSKCGYNLANECLLLISKSKNEQFKQSEIKEIWKIESKYSSSFAVTEQQLELQTEKFEIILDDLRQEIINLRNSVLQKAEEHKV